MRTTLAVLLVLQAFLKSPGDSPLYGYELRKLTGLSPATVSNVLLRLLSEGLIEQTLPPAQHAAAGPERKYYTLTEAGKDRGVALVSQELRQLDPAHGPRNSIPIPIPIRVV